MDEHRQARAVPVEKEHEDNAQGQLKNPAADLRTARQQPVAHLPQVRFDRHDHGRTLLIDGVPHADQPLTDQRNASKPGRRFGQAFKLYIFDKRGGVTHVVCQVKTQPHQRPGHQQHPANGQDAGGQCFATIEPAR